MIDGNSKGSSELIRNLHLLASAVNLPSTNAIVNTQNSREHKTTHFKLYGLGSRLKSSMNG